MPLEYPITKPYTIRHLTTYVSGVSVVAIAGLAVLNFVLQGHEVVTVLRPNPNITESPWWSPKSLPGWHSAGDCQPVSLSRQSSFHTNSSLFSYDLRSTFDSNGQNVMGATPYIANPLSSCTVGGILVNVNLARRTYKFDVPILCTGPELPFSLSLISSLSLNANPYYDDISAYYLLNKPSREGLDSSTSEQVLSRNASSLTNIIGILDALSSDVQVALSAAGGTSTVSRPTALSTGGLLACPGGQSTTCDPKDMRMMIPRSETDYANGTSIIVDGPGPVSSIAENSMLNMFIALQDAYHIDLGNIQPSNVFLSKDAFSTLIKPDPGLTTAVKSNSDMSICTWALGCVTGTTWTDRLLASDQSMNITVPTVLPSGNAPAVVRVDYLCPQFRIKSPGSLITSVFIGTWSMYIALFGVFGFVGPMLEKRYGRRDEGGSIDEGTLGYEKPSEGKSGYFDPPSPSENTRLA